MLFDPDAGLPIEELIQRKWDHEWSAERKARILAIAEAMGCTWWDVVMECMERYCDALEDPIEAPRIKAKWDFEEMPFGPDPRLSQDGAR